MPRAVRRQLPLEPCDAFWRPRRVAPRGQKGGYSCVSGPKMWQIGADFSKNRGLGCAETGRAVGVRGLACADRSHASARGRPGWGRGGRPRSVGGVARRMRRDGRFRAPRRGFASPVPGRAASTQNGPGAWCFPGRRCGCEPFVGPQRQQPRWWPRCWRSWPRWQGRQSSPLWWLRRWHGRHSSSYGQSFLSHGRQSAQQSLQRPSQRSHLQSLHGHSFLGRPLSSASAAGRAPMPRQRTAVMANVSSFFMCRVVWVDEKNEWAGHASCRMRQR